MNKKIFAAVLSSAMLFTGVAGAASFTDMPTEERAAQAIENAVKNGLLSGYEDNTVRPDANIRRCEMAVIISQACKVTDMSDLSAFSDVNTDDWFYNAMSKAKAMGAFSGDGDKMRPNDNISFQECFTVLSQVFHLLPAGEEVSEVPENLPDGKAAYGKSIYDVSILDKFSDGKDVASWAKPFVAGVVVNGGWNGENGMLTPASYITRAQFAEVMDNLIQNYIDEPGTYSELPDGNTMIRCDGVVLKDATVKGDIYIGDNVSPNGLTVENLTSEKRFVIRGCSEPTKQADGSYSYSDEAGIKISGKFNSIEIIRPYINLDMSETEYTWLYGVRNSLVLIP